MIIKVCFICQQSYIPKHQTKYDAYISDDKESREQWLSGCCSNKCWDSWFAEKIERMPFPSNLSVEQEVFLLMSKYH